jgi:hypothetical protein
MHTGVSDQRLSDAGLTLFDFIYSDLSSNLCASRWSFRAPGFNLMMLKEKQVMDSKSSADGRVSSCREIDRVVGVSHITCFKLERFRATGVHVLVMVVLNARRIPKVLTLPFAHSPFPIPHSRRNA